MICTKWLNDTNFVQIEQNHDLTAQHLQLMVSSIGWFYFTSFRKIHDKIQAVHAF